MGCSCVRIVGFLLLLFAVSAVGAVNITDVLQKFPSFSILNRILSVTDVADEINRRSAFTLLAPDDSVLDPVVRALNGSVPVDYVTNVLRYHVLLQYLDIPGIKAITNASGDLLATLYKASGNAADKKDFLNLTTNSANIMIGIPGAESPPNAAVVTNLTQSPFSYSILQIDHVLIPSGLQLSPSAPAPAPAPSQSLPNITDALEKAGRFSVLLSLLQQTGLASALAENEMKSGLTLFAPTDDAFSALPSSDLATLTDSQKKTLLLYHALPAFFSLTQLQSLSNPSMKTLASGSNGMYTVDISSTTGTVTIATGVDTAEVTTTLVNQTPVSVYAINKVLLPPEIFIHSPGPAPAPAPAPAPGPAPALGPASSPAPITHLTPGPSPLASSPPAPPTMTPSGGAAPTPRSPPKSPASSLSASLLHLSAAAMFSLYFLS